MRLDLFLKASRLVIRRTVAQALCDAGVIELNGVTAKSSRTVQPGDILVVRRAGRLFTVKISAVPATKQVSKQASNELYEVISDEADPMADPFDSE